jgi:uncharacterized protein YyaL (SSP411 family)
LDAALEEDRQRLLAARDGRIRPHRDEKIIVAWNGYMLEAFARAGWALGEPRYVQAAVKAARFLKDHLWQEGRLMRHYRDRVSDVPGYLDDYAFLGRGLLALYEATFDPRYLEDALHLAQEVQRLFTRPGGGFSFNGIDAEELLAPVVETYDGALPSGNSTACLFMLELGHLTANAPLEDRGREVLRAFRERLEQSPTGHLEMLSALDFSLGPATEVVIAGDPQRGDTAALLDELRGRYLPNTVVALHSDSYAQAIRALIPYLTQQIAKGGEATAYVCRDYACRLPVQTPDELAKALVPE